LYWPPARQQKRPNECARFFLRALIWSTEGKSAIQLLLHVISDALKKLRQCRKQCKKPSGAVLSTVDKIAAATMLRRSEENRLPEFSGAGNRFRLASFANNQLGSARATIGKIL
jgi:hypothetical protein